MVLNEIEITLHSEKRRISRKNDISLIDIQFSGFFFPSSLKKLQITP